MAFDLHKAQTLIIFLPQADPAGIRLASIQMSTIQAMAFGADEPVADLAPFRSILSRPGVYVLVGRKGEQDLVRIGQSENVFGRLKRHRETSAELSAKAPPDGITDTDLGDNTTDDRQFYPHWNTTLAFTTKDDTLTAGHIRYIESSLTKLADQSYVLKIVKGQTPGENAGSLPLHEKATAESFVRQVVVLSGALGFDFFTTAPLRQVAPSVPEPASHSGASRTAQGSQLVAESESFVNEHRFFYKNHGVDASMESDGSKLFRVLKNSQARLNEAQALPTSTKLQRQRLLEEGILKEENGHYLFTRDHDFKSLAAATQTVAGSTEWGKQVWKLLDGRTLGQWQLAIASADARPTAYIDAPDGVEP